MVAQEVPSLYHTKWYLNAAQISSFAWNDSSKINSCIPAYNYILFKTDQLEIGMDSSENQRAKRTLFEYRMNSGPDHTGQIFLYRTAKEKKKKVPFAYYEYKLTPFELILTTYPEKEIFPDISHTETLVFSMKPDSLQLSTKILGVWKSEPSPYKFFDQSQQDTIVLTRSQIDKNLYDRYFYTFERIESVLTCTARFFVSPDIKDRMFYDISNRYNYSLDLSNKQLIFLEKYGNKVYDILEINESRLILKLHRE